MKRRKILYQSSSLKKCIRFAQDSRETCFVIYDIINARFFVSDILHELIGEQLVKPVIKKQIHKQNQL